MMRPPARILPILTEVVPPQVTAAPPVAATPEFEEIVRTVLLRANDLIEQRMAEQSRALADRLDQMQSLQLQLRQELEQFVRQAVAEALQPD
jgi:hypothetical protein